MYEHTEKTQPYIIRNKMISFRNPICLAGVLFAVIFSCSLLAEDDQGQDDRKLVAFFRGLYHREPADSPARYALNQIASRHSWRAFHILKGDWPSNQKTRQQARSHLLKLKNEIERGMNWPIKTPPIFYIPLAKNPPKIDGHLNDAIWRKALVLRGEYPLNSVKLGNKNSLWMIAYDQRNIYIGASFKDKNSVGVGYIPDQKVGPWQGDSLEVFFMPSKRLRDYREIVVGCNGTQFSSLHVNDKWGTFINGPANENVKTIKAKVISSKSGYTVELAVPFKDLPNYMSGNAPESGGKIYFGLFRTNVSKKGSPVEFSSAFPLMYDSHNIFGYATGIFM